ncbi:hypothetical protein D3C77_607190 [compost metagenome]
MGDEEEHLAGLAPDIQQQLLDGFTRQRVQRRHRLVHQQHGGVAGQGAGNAHALLHAAGQLVDHVAVKVLQAHQFQVAAGAGAPCGFVHAL